MVVVAFSFAWGANVFDQGGDGDVVNVLSPDTGVAGDEDVAVVRYGIILKRKAKFKLVFRNENLGKVRWRVPAYIEMVLSVYLCASSILVCTAIWKAMLQVVLFSTVALMEAEQMRWPALAFLRCHCSSRFAHATQKWK